MRRQARSAHWWADTEARTWLACPQGIAPKASLQLGGGHGGTGASPQREAGTDPVRSGYLYVGARQGARGKHKLSYTVNAQVSRRFAALEWAQPLHPRPLSCRRAQHRARFASRRRSPPPPARAAPLDRSCSRAYHWGDADRLTPMIPLGLHRRLSRPARSARAWRLWPAKCPRRAGRHRSIDIPALKATPACDKLIPLNIRVKRPDLAEAGDMIDLSILGPPGRGAHALARPARPHPHQ